MGNRLTCTADIHHRPNQTWANMSAACRLLWHTSSHLENLYVSKMHLRLSRRNPTSISPWQLLHLGFVVPESCDHASIDDWMSPQRWGIPPGMSSMVHFRLAEWFRTCNTSKISRIKSRSSVNAQFQNWMIYLEAKSSKKSPSKQELHWLEYMVWSATQYCFIIQWSDANLLSAASHSCDIHKSSTLSQHLEKVCTDSPGVRCVRAKEEGGEGSKR